MIGEVVNTIVYPIKGMRGFEMRTRGIRTSTRLGVVGDRQFAVYRRITNIPTEHKPKGQFHVCQNRQGMAKKVGTIGFLEEDLDENYALNPIWVDGVLRGHGLPMDESTLVHCNGEYHQADTNKPCVSFLNLASVRWLEEQTGETIDPHRFRMNVWVEGLEPWAELKYITAWQQGERFPMWVGDVQVYCDDICERCKSVNQSPANGYWDIELLDMIKEHVGARRYKSPQRGVSTVMGWLAIPQSDGEIKIGQKLTFGTN